VSWRSLLALIASLLVIAGLTGACGADSPGTAATVGQDGGGTGGGGDAAPVKVDSGLPVDSGVVAPAPQITGLAPSKASVGTPGPLLVVQGSDFVTRSVVKVDGDVQLTTFVSPKELRITLPTAKLAAVAILKVTVLTAPPGGGESAPFPFSVENAIPILTGLVPLSATAGAPDVNLTVTGAYFSTAAVVKFGPTALATTFVDSTRLTAKIPSASITASGGYPITVENPTPGGGTSNAISFTVTNPTIVLASVTPNVAIVSSAAKAITVTGTGFVPATTLAFNGSAIPTTFVSSTQLTGTIPATALTAVGVFPVVASNPPPGGGVSAPLAFRVEYAAPTVATLAPDSATAGSPPVTVTVTGTDFYTNSQVTFDGLAAATTYVSGTELQATLGAAKLANAGTVAVRVTTPAPGGGTSGTILFTVNNPAPTLATLLPDTAGAGSPATVFTAVGTGFAATSVLQVNGVAVATTYLTPTLLNGTIPAASLATQGVLSITVFNPAPGGGTSGDLPFTVGCDSTGVDVQLGPVGTVTTKNTGFGLGVPMSRFVVAGVCPTNFQTPNEPGRYFIVQNTAAAPVTLSTWAVCTSPTVQEDCFMTIYRRATPPANDTERRACTGVVAEGLNEPGGYASPERGISGYCPGLTKANGGGIVLAVCERAVVHVQPWSNASTLYPPPAQLRFKPE
jgi:hypothetical protein